MSTSTRVEDARIFESSYFEGGLDLKEPLPRLTDIMEAQFKMWLRLVGSSILFSVGKGLES